MTATSDIAAARAAVAEASRTLADAGLLVGTAGNVSTRVGEFVAVTATGAVLAELTPEQVTVVTLDGEIVEGEFAPTSETALHLGVLRAAPADRVGAVVHTHAPLATALSLVVDEVPVVHYQQLLLGGSLRVAGFHTFGSAELARAVGAALDGRLAALMANHGAIALGRDLADAVSNALLTEWGVRAVLARAGDRRTPHPRRRPAARCHRGRDPHGLRHDEEGVVVKNKPIARGRSAEVYAEGDDRVIKLAFAGVTRAEVDDEIAASQLAHALGLTPVRCYGAVEIDGRHGMALDRIVGVPLTAVAERNILRLPEVGRTLATEHLFVHRAHTSELPDVRELALAQLDTPALAALTAAERDAVAARIRALPAGDAVLHLDFHPQNVFVLADRNVVIDWQTATSGPAAADVALTRLLFREAELFPGTALPMRVVYAAVRRILLRFYLGEYLRAGTVTVAELDRWEIAARVLRLGLLDIPSERERMIAGIRAELARS